MSTGGTPAKRTSPSGPVMLTLTSVQEARRPRADAARNRARLLEAAARLTAECGAAKLTMDAVATAASVGKGTVFRHFGDRTGLLLALIDHQELRLQESFLSGPPPLGPGAPAVQRLLAFGPAVLRHEEAHLELYLAADAGPSRRFTIEPRQARLTHLRVLIGRAEPAMDAELLAQTLLSYLDTGLVHHLIRQLGMPRERLETGWQDLVSRLVR